MPSTPGGGFVVRYDVSTQTKQKTHQAPQEYGQKGNIHNFLKHPHTNKEYPHHTGPSTCQGRSTRFGLCSTKHPIRIEAPYQLIPR